MSRRRRYGRHAWLCVERRRVEIEGEKRLEELYRELEPGAVVGTNISPMFVAADAQHERAGFVVFDRRLGVGFSLGL